MCPRADADAALPEEWLRKKRDASEFPCLVDTGETWVHQLPDGLVDELVAATNLPSIAERWAACEELRGAEPVTLLDVLRDLQRLARTARESGKALLLWTSL